LFCKITLVPETKPDTVPPTVAVTAFVVQVIATVLTFALTVPVPAATAHVCPGLVGSVRTVTAYAPPLATAVLNTKVPFAVTVRSSPPLSCKTTLEPVTRPVTDPPTVNGPPPEPEPDPDPELEPFTPAQATSKIESAVMYKKKKGLKAAFI
jgi:hypothetical protein